MNEFATIKDKSVNRQLRGLAALFVLAIGTFAATLCFAQNARAQSLSLVRDAEIEALLKSYTTPIFKAAGLSQRAVDVYLVNNRSFNAFVTDRRMFIHTGAIMESETPNQIIGVIAHETGHIIGGHQQRMRERMDRAKALAAVGILLGAGAMASGGDIGDAAGQAILQGGGSMLQRSLLAYKRDEESSADRAALTLLEKTKQSGRGMLQSFERMGSRMLFSTSRIDPYIQSHPLPAQRIALLTAKAEESRYFDSKDPPELQLRHDMARAKIAAYTGGLGAVQRLFDRDQSNPAAQYGVAISEFLRGRTSSAIPMIDKLIAKYPRNSYLHEMKAEMLLKAQRANEAVRPMQTALKLAPYDTGLLNIQFGQILMETRNPANLQVAIRELKKGLVKDPNTISGYAYLARAYSMSGQEGLALSATAEQRFLQGRFDDAKSFAARAQQKLPKNSPEWVRMQDITLYKKKK